MCLAVVGSFPRGALPLRSCCCCKLHAARETDGQSDPEKKKYDRWMTDEPADRLVALPGACWLADE